ncbi:MAG TPA: hypothetical protein VEX35_09480 [Allosphingosinicella sp.]|nr:hypothetical protein [Allosphingosinicella sp.]
MHRIVPGAAPVLLACLAVPAAAQDDASQWPACANAAEETRTVCCPLGR